MLKMEKCPNADGGAPDGREKINEREERGEAFASEQAVAVRSNQVEEDRFISRD